MKRRGLDSNRATVEHNLRAGERDHQLDVRAGSDGENLTARPTHVRLPIEDTSDVPTTRLSRGCELLPYAWWTGRVGPLHAIGKPNEDRLGFEQIRLGNDARRSFDRAPLDHRSSSFTYVYRKRLAS